MLLLLLLLLHLLPLSHALVTVFRGHRPFPLEHLHPEACVERVTAGEVAVGKSAMCLMLAAIGDELEITHRAGEALSVCFNRDSLKGLPGAIRTVRNVYLLRYWRVDGLS